MQGLHTSLVDAGVGLEEGEILHCEHDRASTRDSGSCNTPSTDTL